ncbi:MAG: YHS domain-containing protein [Deltaproteobacteria bacterium]|jgi:YHS domain-containing protein|nr:YHS domain-containing protein [Deltaproteobacteria bacterium]
MAAKNDVEPLGPTGFVLEILLDPVCGEEIEDPASAPSVTRLGQQLYFCGERCKQRFLLDPQRYLVSGIEIK